MSYALWLQVHQEISRWEYLVGSPNLMCCSTSDQRRASSCFPAANRRSSTYTAIRNGPCLLMQPKTRVNLHSRPAQVNQNRTKMRIPQGAGLGVPIQGSDKRYHRVLVQRLSTSIEPCRRPPPPRQSHPGSWPLRAVDASLYVSLCRIPDFRDVPLQCDDPKRRSDGTYRSRCLRQFLK